MNLKSQGATGAMVGLLLLFTTAQLPSTAFGQNSQSIAGRDELSEIDPISFQGRTDFQVSKPAEVPRQVARAAQREHCDFKESIEQFPIRFFVEKGRRFVLVYCQSIVGYHLIFDLADLRRPRLVEFPFLAQNTGFGVTPRPGIITWRQEAGFFEAEAGTDACPSPRLRHVYRLGPTEGFVSQTVSFVLVSVDIMEPDCVHDKPWSTVWKSPKWPELGILR
jgi:hypothetical protein